MEELPLWRRNWLKDFHRMAELVQFWEGRFHVKTGHSNLTPLSSGRKLSIESNLPVLALVTCGWV
jgi:hypothetical protein